MKSKNQLITPTRLVHAMMAVAVVFALTFVMFIIGTKMLGEGVIALLYLVPCGWCTVRWGRIAGISAALTAALSFDFLFIPPYGTFNIGSLEGWLLLILFIGASILVVNRYQTMLADEKNRERKATYLYEVVASIANQQTRNGIARIIADKIQQIYLADLVQVHLVSRGKLAAVVACSSDESDCTAKSKPDRTQIVVSGAVIIGEITIWKGLLPLPAQDDVMMQTILRQLTAALDRVQVSEEIASTTAHPEPENLFVPHSI